MSTLVWIVVSTFVISLGALVGALTLAMNKEKLSKILLFFVSLSAGALMGGAFIHLLPEALENLEPEPALFIVLASFVLFFLVEKIFHWRHCHKNECHVHTFGFMNLFGDGVHNFIDGLIIAATFVADIKLGIATTLAVALHEIPQEIGDFGVLLYAGFQEKKALVLNYTVAVFVIIGGVVGYFMSTHLEKIVPVLLPLAAGGFIYIAASDLMPEIRKERTLGRSIASFGVFVLGVVMMLILRD